MNYYDYIKNELELFVDFVARSGTFEDSDMILESIRDGFDTIHVDDRKIESSYSVHWGKPGQLTASFITTDDNKPHTVTVVFDHLTTQSDDDDYLSDYDRAMRGI